jgi:uncharacterized protein
MSAMAEPAFIQQQYAFAAHIRDPRHNAAPAGIEDRRMGIYRELFFNNVEGFLASSFPVLRKLMDDHSWHALARDFFAGHRCHSPLFLDIPREFLDYLDEERDEQGTDLPFMRELAHYEWVELALSVAENDQGAPVAVEGDLLAGAPLLSPLAWPLAYQYPVHRISPDFQPQEPDAQPTYLLVYRDTRDQVGFIELNPVSARLFSLLQEQPEHSGRALLQQIVAELQHPDPGLVIESGHAILDEWRRLDIVRGISPNSPEK